MIQDRRLDPVVGDVDGHLDRLAAA